MFNILQFLFLVFIVSFVIIAFVIWLICRKIHKAVNDFNKQFGSSNQSRQQEHYQQKRTTKTDSGETIIDTRSEEQVSQKIFGKDEGEYVDYEVKE